MFLREEILHCSLRGDQVRGVVIHQRHGHRRRCLQREIDIHYRVCDIQTQRHFALIRQRLGALS